MVRAIERTKNLKPSEFAPMSSQLPEWTWKKAHNTVEKDFHSGSWRESMETWRAGKGLGGNLLQLSMSVSMSKLIQTLNAHEKCNKFKIQFNYLPEHFHSFGLVHALAISLDNQLLSIIIKNDKWEILITYLLIIDFWAVLSSWKCNFDVILSVITRK